MTITQAMSKGAADEIEVMDGLQAIRRRPAMYLHGTGTSALAFVTGEVIAHLAFVGARTIDVVLAETISIVASGARYPREQWSSSRRDVLIAAWGTLYACACHADARGHTCDPAIATALSSWLDVEAVMYGERRRARWEDGVLVQTSKGAADGPADGLRAQFTPDPVFFGPIDDRTRHAVRHELERRLFERAAVAFRSGA